MFHTEDGNERKFKRGNSKDKHKNSAENCAPVESIEELHLSCKPTDKNMILWFASAPELRDNSNAAR